MFSYTPKKFFWTLALAALCSAPAFADKGVQVICVDGTVHEVVLKDVERIDISAGKVTVHSASDEPCAHDISDIERIAIGTEVSAVDDILAPDETAVWPTLVTSTVNITGAPEGTPVNVVSLSGAIVTSAVSNGSNLSLDLSAAAPGIYIVSVGKNSVKISKK